MLARIKKHRLFIGLRPAGPKQRQISDESRDWPWRRAHLLRRAPFYHLTLIPLKMQMLPPLAVLDEALSNVSFRPFEIVLEQPDRWPGSDVAVLRPAHSLELMRLRCALWSTLHDLRVKPGPRSWTPHVTLANHAADVELPSMPVRIPWTVSRFLLIWSLTLHGGRLHYEILGRYCADPSGAPLALPPHATDSVPADPQFFLRGAGRQPGFDWQ